MLRVLSVSDIDHLLWIENAVHISPWEKDAFVACFDAGGIGWLIELDKKIIGFIIVLSHVDECHILNIAVAHDYQHRGFGKQLLEYTLLEAKKNNMHMVYLEVRRSNHRAISLYEQMNFKLIGERKDYYMIESGGYEDALIYAKNLKEANT